MKSERCEETHMPESPKRDARHVSIGEGGLPASVTEEDFFSRRNASSASSGAPRKTLQAWKALNSPRRTGLRELSGATVRLQRLLADTYPELARVQRLETWT